MKLKDMIKELKEFHRMICLDNPNAIYFCAIEAICVATIPFISLYYSSMILDDLIVGNIDLAKEHIILLLIGTFVLGVIGRICHQVLDVTYASIETSVSKQTAHKAHVISYEKLECTETLDSIKRAKNSSMGSGGVGEQLRGATSLLTDLMSVIYSTTFTIQLFIKTNGSVTFSLYTFILVCLFLLFMWYGQVINHRIMDSQIRMNKENDHGNAFTNYLISSAVDVQNGKDIRLYKMNKIILYWFDYFLKTIGKSYHQSAHYWGKQNGKLVFTSQLFAACIYIYVGINVLQENVSVGNVFLYTGAITRLTTSIKSAMRDYGIMAYRFDYIHLFEDFIFSTNMSYDGTLPIEKRDDGEYLLEFRNVSFKYPNTENYVLKNINLKFDLHKRLAIVGQNGAGKTTLIKLLCRLYEPTEGEILLNGVNISLYNYAEYTRIFSVVFQDFKLFPLPLDQNIACGDNVNQELVLKCIEDVGLKDTVEAWPDKEKTLLYKNLGDGVNVSGGEAQKIAIARALYKDAPFVIMDEPTAALDPLSEAEIYENFNELVKDKTSIFVSHRMSSCKFCDEIIVFEDGEIVEKGSHQALLENHGLYRSLWDAQAQYYVD